MAGWHRLGHLDWRVRRPDAGRPSIPDAADRGIANGVRDYGPGPPVLVEQVRQPGEGFVDVKRETEASTGFERDEAVQGGADDAGRVDRVVRLETVAAQYGEDDVDGLRSCSAASASSGSGARWSAA